MSEQESELEEHVNDIVDVVTNKDKVDQLYDVVMKLVEDVKLIKEVKPIEEIVSENSLKERDFDVNKDGIIDSNEKALYDSYTKSNLRIIEYSEKTVKMQAKNALWSNIILGAIFLLQLILTLVK